LVDVATIYEAVNAAQRSHPYYRTGIDSLRLQEDRAVPTMATSAQWVTHYNPDTLATWTAEQAGAVLVHELEHLLRGHHERCGDRDPGAFNRSGDIEINQRLANLPDGALYPETINAPRGLSAETYYSIENGARKAPEPEPGDGAQGDDSQPGAGSGSGEGSEGEGSEGEGSPQPSQPSQPGTASCGSAAGGPTQPHEQGDAARPGAGAEDDGKAVRKSVAESILGGLAPGTADADDLREWAEGELSIDRSAWYSALATAIGKALAPHGAPTRWTWPGRRDERDMGGAVLPRWTGTRPECAVIIDTSISIDPADLDLARAAALFLSRAADCNFYTCNTQPTALGKSLPDVLHGNGGTNLSVGIARAIADGAKCIVVVTDCGTYWHDDEYRGVPVIVAANRGATGILNGDKDARWYPADWMTIIPLVTPEGW
jgi:hypothetical protein